MAAPMSSDSDGIRHMTQLAGLVDDPAQRRDRRRALDQQLAGLRAIPPLNAATAPVSAGLATHRAPDRPRSPSPVARVLPANGARDQGPLRLPPLRRDEG